MKPPSPPSSLLPSLLITGCLVLAGCGPAATPPAAPTTTPTAERTPTSIPTATLEPPTATPTAGPTLAPTPDLSAFASDFPNPALYEWRPVVSGLEQPVDIESAGDASGRLFVIERAGRIRIIQEGELVEEPFLDIQSKILSFGSEQGLLGVAFDPEYAQNGRFYVNYTDERGDTVIARYQAASAEEPNLADPASEEILLQVAQPFLNHNGGSMVFGPDGYLYMGLGDGGSGGDPFNNGQSVNTLLGKILRVDVSEGDPYTVPADNPFASGGGTPEIWQYGLRNPWRIAFDRQSGNLYIADVGQNEWEEINFVPAGTGAGLNFGWNVMEGNHLFGGGPTHDLVLPIAEYSHREGGCSVTGGEVYRGQAMPEWNGVYLYGDYCSGMIWGLLPAAEGWRNELLFHEGFRITSFGLDEAGEVYLATYSDGGIYQLAAKSE